MKREYYPISDAAKLLGCKIPDLLHLAATRKIVLSTYISEEIIKNAVMLEGDKPLVYNRDGLIPDKAVLWRMGPANPHIWDLPINNAVELDRQSCTSVGNVTCRGSTVTSSLQPSKTVEVGKDLFLTIEEIEKAKEFVKQPEYHQATKNEAPNERFLKKTALIKSLKPYLVEGKSLEGLLSNASRNPALCACKSPTGRKWGLASVLRFLAEYGYLKEDHMHKLADAGFEKFLESLKS